MANKYAALSRWRECRGCISKRVFATAAEANAGAVLHKRNWKRGEKKHHPLPFYEMRLLPWLASDEQGRQALRAPAGPVIHLSKNVNILAVHVSIVYR